MSTTPKAASTPTLDGSQEAQVFEAFKRYPFEADNVFQQGLESILEQLSKVDQPKDEQDIDLYQDLQLLKAKHFYFTRFQQKFDLERYLEYEAEKAGLRKEEAFTTSREEQEKLFERIEGYDYENDVEYAKGMPNIIKGWIAQQSKSGLWDKEKLNAEFAKAKAFFFNARVEKVDLLAYFKWRARREQANAPSCPFANLWQNKLGAGPTSQINGATFIVADKPKNQRFGATLLTLASPKTRNVLSYDRLKELATAIQQAESDTQITSIFINASVADDSVPDQFSSDRIIETKDTKIWSSGLAYEETSKMVAGSELRQISLQKLASQYYDNVRSLIGQSQTRAQSSKCHEAAKRVDNTKMEEIEASKPTSQKKLIVCFLNGEVPLNAAYLTLGPWKIRVITEFTLVNFTLRVSHAPMPPLLLLAMARARAMALAATQQSGPKKTFVTGLELYLALATPVYGKLRGPELLRLGFADAFIPEAKLNDTIDTAKKLAVCPVDSNDEDTHTAAIQLALAIHYAYPGPDRLQVWEDQIESTFGKAESLENLKSRLEKLDNTWSRNILAYWATLPPILLNIVYKAVQESAILSPIEILDLEKKLNAKWRQTEDYRTWLKCKLQQDQDLLPAWISDQGQVNETVESCFTDSLSLQNIADEPVVFEAPQEPAVDFSMPFGVCPVTGQVSGGLAVCPATGQSNLANTGIITDVCPVTGQRSDVNTTVAGFTGANFCPVTGARGGAESLPEKSVTRSDCSTSTTTVSNTTPTTNV